MKNYRENKMNLAKKFTTLLLIIVTAIILPACGSDGSHSDEHKQETQKKEYWTCTMHPQIISDKPGVCPICQMELIKKVADETPTEITDKDMAEMVTLGGNKQILANVSLYEVKEEKLYKEFTAYSYLDFVEQNRKTISARFNGRIEKLFVDKTGDHVSKGEPLFEIYSPDLVQAQNEYLIALDNSLRAGNIIEAQNPGSSSTPLLKAAKKKLELFGLTQNQISELGRSRDIQFTLTYYSPINGTVIEKRTQEGMYVSEGTAIYEIADLTTLWNISEVYEDNLGDIKIGNPVKLNLKAYSGEEFNGKVTFIYPVVNQQTRTVKVRSEFASRSGKLKPQMYGETTYQINKGNGLLVPADAVLFTGKRTVVWAKAGDGMFEAHNVKVGEKFGNKYQILSGLDEGDQIAATGGFLIDSESQLKSGMPSGHQHGENTAPAKPNSAEQSTEHKNH